MGKLLIICGPTATGKTALAIHLAKVFDGVIISADSRQVYKGMDIGTGKDRSDDTEILGYDLVDPKDDFSVSGYLDFAHSAILNILHKGKLPIVVGGTGFYIKGLIDGIGTSGVPRNESLRKSLEKFTTSDLYDKLAQLDPTRAASMNSSDKKNPRRLVRAIEIAQSRLTIGPDIKVRITDSHDVLFVGLSASKDVLSKLIEKRVLERVKMGVVSEIKKLLNEGVLWTHQSMTSLGYKHWKEFFEGKKNKEEVVEMWIQDEIKYASRQMVWFKRDKRINWFDISDPNLQKNVEKQVIKWYSSDNADKN